MPLVAADGVAASGFAQARRFLSIASPAWFTPWMGANWPSSGRYLGHHQGLGDLPQWPLPVNRCLLADLGTHHDVGRAE